MPDPDTRPGAILPFEIVYEDAHLLVVDKPAGIATMGVADTRPSVLSAAKSYLSATSPSGFVAVMGRLDFPVSGLIVIGKTPNVADQLRVQQEDGTLAKEYHALVAGDIEPTSGELTHWLVPSKRHRHVEVVDRVTDGAKLARLSYRVLSRCDCTSAGRISLISVELETGRKHQIRAQFGTQGHPILGDRKYGSRQSFPHGIALICKRIRLAHPVERHPIQFESPGLRAGRASGTTPCPAEFRLAQGRGFTPGDGDGMSVASSEK